MLAASAWRRRARHAGVALRAQHAGVALRARRGRALEKQVFERLGRMLQWSCNIIPWHARNRQPLQGGQVPVVHLRGFARVPLPLPPDGACRLAGAG